jgi:hypothetical protein
MKDHKLVFVAKNQADGLRQQVTQLGHFVKAPDAENNSTRRETLCSDQLVSYG